LTLYFTVKDHTELRSIHSDVIIIESKASILHELVAPKVFLLRVESKVFSMLVEPP
jgi:hypothetical protein